MPFGFRARLRRALRWSGLALVLLGLIPAGATATPVPVVGNAKTACIYSHNSIREMREIGARIGRPFQCASIYNTVPTWKDWTNPWFIHHVDPDYQWPEWVRADPVNRRMVIGQSMIPTEGMPKDWRRRGAAGQYDARIRTLARNLVRVGLGNSVIRLGYEANGDWNADNVGRTDAEYEQWRAYWARFARIMKSVPGGQFTLDWNLNSAYRAIPLEKIYPGDRAVDLIGIDVYDSAGPKLPAAPSPSRWDAIIGQPGGVRDILEFAVRHGKPISIPEWGLASSSHKGGGDNPNFVASIAALVRNNTVAYQSYFNNDLLPGCLEIQKSRRAFAAYARNFGRASQREQASGLPTARRS